MDPYPGLIFLDSYLCDVLGPETSLTKHWPQNKVTLDGDLYLVHSQGFFLPLLMRPTGQP